MSEKQAPNFDSSNAGEERGGISLASWHPALACCLGIAVSYPVVLPTATALIVGPLRAEFGWEPSSTLLALLIAVLVGLVSGPGWGAVADRFGALRVVLFCLAAEALLLLSFLALDDDIMFFYARYAALATLAAGANSSAYVKVIRSAYVADRGVAIGIAFAGTGIGGVLWSLVAGHYFPKIESPRVPRRPVGLSQTVAA